MPDKAYDGATFYGYTEDHGIPYTIDKESLLDELEEGNNE